MKPFLAAFCLIFSSGTLLALPPAVELDRRMLHAKTALEAKSYNEAANQLAQAKKLGITLPEHFALDYATALAGRGNADEAKVVLDEYFRKYGTKGASYKGALELLVQLDEQERPISKTQTPSTSLSSAPAPKSGANQGSTDQSRPPLPFAVSEDIWRTIEASEAYRNAPRSRAYKVSYQANDQSAYTGPKSSSLPSPPASSTRATLEATVLGNKCALQQRNTFLSTLGKNFASGNYVCGGFLPLGATQDGNPYMFIKSLDELKGSLLPMRIGNQMTLRYQIALMSNRQFEMTTSSSCQVMGQGAARELHPQLTGTAWKVRCQNIVSSNNGTKPIESEIDDYYLEDLGLRLSAIGQSNYLEKKIILPQPGDQTVRVTTGDYGARTTTTYTSYDWSVGGNDPATGKSAQTVPPTALAQNPENWGLSDQDLSTMIGTNIMKKVRMVERRADILAAAQAGDMVSQYLIGASYDYGTGVGKDAVQKVLWLSKAAEQGLVRARAALAIARINGDGMPQDDISGWSMLLASANAGNAIAQYNAAILTLRGTDAGGMPRQYKFLEGPAALALLRRSAEAGLSFAQYSLGHSYMVGTEENPKDLQQSRYWLEKAAAQNLPEAVTALAKISPNN